MADEIAVSIGAKIDEALAGIAQLKDQLSSINSVVSKVNDSFTTVGKTILGALGLGLTLNAMDGFVRGMAEAGLRSEQLGAQLGVTGSKLGEMKAIAKLTGVDMDVLALGISRLSLNVQNAQRDAFSPQAQALKVLGLATKDLLNLPADQYFGKLAEAVSKFNPSLNLTNALMQLGGRSVVQMLPALLMGKEAFEKWGDQLKRAREGLSGFAPAASDTHARLVVFDATVDSLSKKIFLALKPAIDLIIDTLTKFFQKLDVETIRKFASTMTDVLANAIVTVIALFMSLGDNIDAVLNRMKRVLGGAALGGALGLFGGPAGAAGGAILGASVVAAWDAFMSSFDKKSDEAGEDVDRNKSKIVAKVLELRDAIKAALAGAFSPDAKAGGKSDAGGIDTGGKAAIEATISRINAEIQLLRGSLGQKQLIYQRDSDLWQITEQEKLRLTKAATAEEYQVEAAKLQQIRNLWPSHTKEWEDANRKMLMSAQNFATEMLRINADMARDMKAKMDEVSNAMQSSFNGQLRGLLAGTTSWRQAFRSIMGDMVIFFIQQVERMVLQWITGKIAMLAMDETTATASAATQVAAAEATLPFRAGKFLSDLTASAALVFAGVFANMAPLLGPGAAGPAGVAQAAVMAQAGFVPKLDVGTDRVLRSGLAMIHAGEKVVPAETSGPFTGSGGGGVTIQAWDGRSVDSWLKRGGAEKLARAISGTMTLQPSTRPGF